MSYGLRSWPMHIVNPSSKVSPFIKHGVNKRTDRRTDGRYRLLYLSDGKYSLVKCCSVSVPHVTSGQKCGLDSFADFDAILFCTLFVCLLNFPTCFLCFLPYFSLLIYFVTFFTLGYIWSRGFSRIRLITERYKDVCSWKDMPPHQQSSHVTVTSLLVCLFENAPTHAVEDVQGSVSVYQVTSRAMLKDVTSAAGPVKRASDPVPTTVSHVIIPS